MRAAVAFISSLETVVPTPPVYHTRTNRVRIAITHKRHECADKKNRARDIQREDESKSIYICVYALWCLKKGKKNANAQRSGFNRPGNYALVGVYVQPRALEEDRTIEERASSWSSHLSLSFLLSRSGCRRACMGALQLSLSLSLSFSPSKGVHMQRSKVTTRHRFWLGEIVRRYYIALYFERLGICGHCVLASVHALYVYVDVECRAQSAERFCK